MPANNINFFLTSDYTGGLNLRADQFQLAPNESPDLLNVEVDPRGGVFSRAGMKFINTSPVGAAVWNPKALYNFRGTSPQIMLSTGYSGTTPGEIHKSTGGNFTRLNRSSGVLNVSNTDGACFTQWDQTLYITVGQGTANAYKWTTSATNVTDLTASGPTWQPYELPVGGFFPRANLCKVHANKMFVANTFENGVHYPNRLRWSHEGRPEDWYDADYIDITAGGYGIRAMEIVDGQLLIFKENAIYLLMGYDIENFQLVEISTIHGVEYPQQVAAGDGGVYFFDYPKGLFFYSRNGIQDVFLRISPIIIDAQVNTTALDDITCSFIGQRLWLSMPYDPAPNTSPPAYAACNFIFDQSIGKYGAYTLYQTADARGVVVGTDWRSSTDDAKSLICSSTQQFVYFVDDYDFVEDDIYTGSAIVQQDFDSYYRTSWFYDNRYVQNKTFLGPEMVLKEVDADTEIKMNVYYDFNSTKIVRTQTIGVYPDQSGGVYGTGLYGTATYGVDDVGPSLYSARCMGKSKAIQLEFIGPNTLFTATPGRKWGINSVAYKFKRRNIKAQGC